MTNEETLKFYEDELAKSLMYKEMMEQAAVMVYANGKRLRDGLLEVAEYFRRCAEDNKFLVEETKIHIEKSKEGK